MNCINCKYKDFEIIEGHPKCYWTCPYRQQNNLNKFMGGIKIE